MPCNPEGILGTNTCAALVPVDVGALSIATGTVPPKRADKLHDWQGELPPDKNHGVFPGKTLPEVRDEAEEEFGGMTSAEMHDRRMAGHGVASRF